MKIFENEPPFLVTYNLEIFVPSIHLKFVLSVAASFMLLAPSITAAAAKSDTAPVIKPMPASMLKKLTITFDVNGKPVFSPKKNIKAIQCDPATTPSGNGKHADLPPCGAAGYSAAQSTTAKASTAKSVAPDAAPQTTDTNCYTIYWVQDGTVYSYTYCWNSTASQ